MSSTTYQTAVGQFVWHDHTSNDPQAAQNFYGKLLGWTYEPFETDQGTYPMITKNGQQHGGFGPSQGGAPPAWVGHVVVDDADAAGKRAEEAGGSVLTAMDIPEVGRFAIIRDPQGAVISAFAPKGGDNPVGQGAFVWDELHTSDLQAAKRFYGDVFGWTANEQDMGGMTYVMFQADGTDRAGAMQQVDEPAPPHWLTYAGTDDVDATTKKAKDLGGSVIVQPADIPGIGRFSIVADPTGAIIGLFQPPA
jgi:uncharacterized protein